MPMLDPRAQQPSSWPEWFDLKKIKKLDVKFSEMFYGCFVYFLDRGIATLPDLVGRNYRDAHWLSYTDSIAEGLRHSSTQYGARPLIVAAAAVRAAVKASKAGSTEALESLPALMMVLHKECARTKARLDELRPRSARRSRRAS